MRKKIWLFLGIFLILIPSVMAVQPSQSTSRINIFPLYRESMSSATNYTYTLAVNPPDGISSVVTAIIFFNAQINGQSQNFTLWVNGKPCNNPSYYIATAFSATGNTQFYFDCSNVINTSGSYTITIRSAVNTGVISGWLDLTYMNKPSAVMTIHGTEYIIEEDAKLWLQLINSTGQYVNNAVCQLNVYYPDGTYFINSASMAFLTNGIYQYNFLTPKIIGVYPAIASCFYTVSTQTETADAGVVWIGSIYYGSYTNTAIDDASYWRINEVSSGGRYRISVVENYTAITPPSSLTALTISFNGRWTSNSDYLTIQIWNYTSSTWYSLSNTIGNTGGSDATVTNTITTTNLTTSGLISGNQIRLRIIDTANPDTTSSQLYIDRLVLELNYLTGEQIVEVRGSSEMHISGVGILYVETNCADGATSEYAASSDCGVFTNDDEFDQTEGEIEDNITVFTLTREAEQQAMWTYETPLSVDCTAIYWLEFDNGTDWVDITDTLSYSSLPDKENCIVKVPITLNPAGVFQPEYYYHIKYDNYMAWEVEYSNDATKVINATLAPLCMSIGQLYNYTYVLPITDATNLSVAPELLGCVRFLDDVYWADYYYNLSQDITTSGDYTAYLIEAKFYRMSLFNELSTGTFFTSYMNGQILNMLLSASPTSNLQYVGGTEYATGQTGSVSAQFITGTTPILIGTCLANITYPNRTLFIENANMTLIANSNGLYQYNFTIPLTEGVYITDIKCTRAIPPTTGITAGTFHVSNSVFNNLSSILNYLITINGTTYNINNSQYNFLLSAINSVNATGNESLSILIALNGSVFQINNTINSQFAQVLALLNQINSSLNTTIENYLSYINGTIVQINQTQATNYLNLLSAINSINSTVNTTLVNYLVYINGTTVQINQSLFNDYTSLLSAINSVNQTLNTSIIQYLVGINGTTYNINEQMPLILQYLNDINITTNTTIPASLISINNTQNANFVNIMNFLASINYTSNTTLELKLDQINTTVVQINNAVNNLSFSVDLNPVLNAIASVNGTINTTVFNLLNQINSTTIQNQNHLMVINGTVFQINDSIIGLINQINSVNSTQNQNYISLYNFLQQINATGNTTLTFVASINTSLLDDYLSLHNFLASINVSINTTMENKLDLINQTVFQINDSLSALNVTVNLTGLYDAMASINETINSTVLSELITINDNILNHNSSEYQHFLAMSVLLNDINIGINTTLENKLDLINSTTWDTYQFLQNLTIGNVSVFANINWTQGYIESSFLSFSDKVGGEGITLQSETLTCLTNTTLQHWINATNCIQGICKNANSTMTEICAHGCANNQCIPTPQFASLSAIGIALVLLGGIYVAYRAWK